VVGRAVSSDCAIVDATVSRRHAELAVKDNGFELKDLGSSNGTFVNGVKVDAYFVTAGDTVTFGKVAFRVDQPAPPVAVPAAPAAAAPAPPRPGATIVRPVAAADPAGLGRHSGSIKAVMAGTANDTEKDRQKLAILLE